MNRIKFGVLGAGRIANKVSQAIESVEEAELYAVASRSLEKAERFKNEHHAKIAYGSYRELVNDRDIDIIYIATPHSQHRDQALLCLNAGKNVLCEKPIAPNIKQAEEIARLAREKNLFLMEAIWTKFLPAVQKALEWIEEGKIGEPRMIQANFCFRTEINKDDRLFDPALAGGSLLDVGVYPLNMASLVFGYHPKEISGTAFIGSTGVDEQGTALLKYENGAIAALSFAIRTDALNDAVIYGTEGYIRIPSFWMAESAELWTGGRLAERFSRKFLKNGYEYEIMEVCRCLQSGKLGSDTAKISDSIEILSITDQLRASWGEHYPFE